MRRISLVVIAALLMATAFGIVAQAQDGPGNVGYGGVQYTTKVADGDKNLILCAGYGYRLKGHLWQFNLGQVGSAGYVSLEPSIGYVFGISGEEGKAHLRGALHGGLASDWVDGPGDGPWINYVPGTIGGTLYLELPSMWGGALTGRQKFTFKDSTRYQDGWILNLNITKRF